MAHELYFRIFYSFTGGVDVTIREGIEWYLKKYPEALERKLRDLYQYFYFASSLLCDHKEKYKELRN